MPMLLTTFNYIHGLVSASYLKIQLFQKNLIHIDKKLFQTI